MGFNVESIRVELLAQEIYKHFTETEVGHCARVDFLHRTEAIAICQYMVQHYQEECIVAYVLTTQHIEVQENPVYIMADKAIERRNRKKHRVCLFVPADLVDAAYSSLSNAFAVIDGRSLHANTLKRVISQLSPEGQRLARTTFAHLRGIPTISDEQRLDFVLSLLERERLGTLDQAGLDLWRVGLIVDASRGFLTKLDSNRDCVLKLARPKKLDATTYERIQNLNVDQETANRLGNFFSRRAMHDVRIWSYDLLQQNLTFDQWLFPQMDRSDIHGVTMTSFINARGEVEKWSRLLQPDGPGGSLRARCGLKEKLIVKWKCTPEQPRNLAQWRISIVPIGMAHDEDALELPEQDVPGKRRNTTIKLDIDFDDPPDFTVCVRVVPLKADGSEIVDEETNEPIIGESSEFFLVRDDTTLPPSTPKESRATTPTLAYGRIEEALKFRDSILDEREPQWSKDQDYFSLRIHDRRLISIGFSTLLLQLERYTLSHARTGGCFLLEAHEIRLASMPECAFLTLETGATEIWTAFWKARDVFFSRLQKAFPRDVVEVAEWTPDQCTGALRYAQTYHELLNYLVSQASPPQELREALSLDTLLVRVYKQANAYEEALVLLPTHPLRIAWLISYHALLRGWETQLFTHALRERKNSIDLHALRLLVPTNVPPFAFHRESPQSFTFFQNMRFFYGVALPAGVPDPHRRYEDIVTILNTGNDQISMGDVQPDHLAEHLLTFQKRHSYTDTLVTTLVNPDRGDFFAEALRKVFSRLQTGDDDEQPLSFPLFQIHAFVEDKQRSTLQAIGNIRQQHIEQNNGITKDYFLPGLMITSRSMEQLDKSALPEAHVAVITDFTRPRIVSMPVFAQGRNDEITSSSLYGLINRFVSLFTADQNILLWQHKIVPEIAKKPEAHPFGSKYSETLSELQTSLLYAQGYLLSGQREMRPVLEVRLEASQRGLLDRLHASANWVITLDRFFTLDYYDSPHTPGLDDVARKYVLDYSPEFTEGLGHRMMVTTAWHEELGSLLGQVMDEMGLASVEQSVSQLLHYLKTVSGKLALQALESSTNAAAAVGLGVVTAWLQRQGRLKQAIIIPVDTYPRLFTQAGSGKPVQGERRCDLVLVALKRNSVDATFIEVKWRRGQALFEELAIDMVFQMHATYYAMNSRFFDDKNRVDGALQRAYLANILRFYFERSRRYNLFDKEVETQFLEHIARLEKTGLALRPKFEGYIVNLENDPRKPLFIDDAKITILTAQDFESTPEFLPPQFQQPLENEEGIISEEQDEERLPEQADHGPADMRPPILHQDGKSTKESTKNVIDNHDQEMPQHKATPLIVPLGDTSGTSIDWTPSVQGSPHLFILGIPGQGKSWTILRMLAALGSQQVPSLVLDFHGQFADPQSPLLQTVHPTILDASKGLPFSPFECSPQAGWSDWKANTQAISEIIAYVAGLGDMQRDVVFTAVRDAYKAHGFDSISPNEIPLDTLEYPTMSEIMRHIEQHEQIRHVPNVIARCRPLLEMDLFRPSRPALDLLTLVRAGCVIDLHNLYAETLQMAAGAFILRKLYKDMFHWGYADRIRLAVVLDEAHRLAKDITLPKLMKEGRKFGVVVIVASQGLGDFHQDVLSNAGTKIIFRMNYPESKKAAGFMRARQGQDVTAHIEQLPVGSAYIQTPTMAFGAIVRMKPLV